MCDLYDICRFQNHLSTMARWPSGLRRTVQVYLDQWIYSVDFRVSQGAWVRIPPLSITFLLCWLSVFLWLFFGCMASEYNWSKKHFFLRSMPRFLAWKTRDLVTICIRGRRKYGDGLIIMPSNWIFVFCIIRPAIPQQKVNIYRPVSFHRFQRILCQPIYKAQL